MATLCSNQNPTSSLYFHSNSPVTHLRLQKLHFTLNTNAFLIEFSKKARVLRTVYRTNEYYSFCCSCQGNSESEQVTVVDESDRPPFDLNLAVVLAGFAFEAYSTPPEDVGRREIDAAECQTVFLSELFLREIYDGQLFVKLKKGFDFPAMDPWGTSDPYVVIQLDGQVAKSKVKWATKEPTWNEDFTFNFKKNPTKNLQVAAWDANLVTPHKRMGNAGINLEFLCDGNLHEVMVELEGMGGGGKIQLEVMYKSFDEIDEEKQWWRIPFMSDYLMKSSFGSALKVALGAENVQARQFVQSAFGQFRSFNFTYLQRDRISSGDNQGEESAVKSLNPVDELSIQSFLEETSQKGSDDNLSCKNENKLLDLNDVANARGNESTESGEYFWKTFADVINQTVAQNLGFSIPEKIRLDGFDFLKKMGLQSRRIAEAEYVESGLATPKSIDGDNGTSALPSTTKGIQSSLSDIKKASWDVLRQTDSIFGALMVLTAAFSQQEKQESGKDASTAEADGVTGYSTNGKENITEEGSVLDERRAEEMKALFSTAESAMEAWAMLATSLGHKSFIKSEFEKICFLDNASTDTQVAIWRDFLRKKLVVAFRGTEQVRWKDLRTDLMLAPAGLNPERLGGDFKEEIQVHSGFLSAYDSVRNRIMSLIKVSIGFVEDHVETMTKWHVYVTGHSLGGALATLLALELCSSQMAKCGAISITMYNFGSPRVGNKRFAEVYNEKVKDSWRIVNHRDIIPTVPRLMGYCHVAQPVYLTTGDLRDALMKGERELVEKILLTEINLFRSIRDGSALMQHMEDFYYITLLESARSNYRTVGSSNSNEEGNSLIT
ncbi:putative triglyceride lipase isoform X2 [Tasmannia lanceolata]|uniref:putative triglyceride lipase isoform X2 n=1 Tax=Tasmannia lanceolata TaxID=3420 RepID=UPI0040645DDB